LHILHYMTRYKKGNKLQVYKCTRALSGLMHRSLL
jgi:hypothetical protein